MANWTGNALTNLVAADNVEALEKIAADHQLKVIRDSDGRIGFIAGTENGDWPTTEYREDLDEHVEFCVETVIMPHIKEGEVLIIMEAGSEKDRYVSGRAEAYIRNGDVCRSVSLSLGDICKMAAEAFAVSLDSIRSA